MIKHVKVSLNPCLPWKAEHQHAKPCYVDYPTAGLHISQLFHQLVHNAEDCPLIAQMHRCHCVPTKAQLEDTVRLEIQISSHKNKVHASQYAQCYRQNCGVMSENWFIDAFVLSICGTCDDPSLHSSEYRIKYAEDQPSSLQSLYARTAEMLGTGRFQTDR